MILTLIRRRVTSSDSDINTLEENICVCTKIKSRPMNDSNAMILMNVGNEHSNQDFIRKAKKAF